MVIVLKAWRPGLSNCCSRGLGFHFQGFSFSFLPPSCGFLDVFVPGAKVILRKRKDNTAAEQFEYDLRPCTFAAFVFPWQLSVSHVDAQSNAVEFTSCLNLALVPDQKTHPPISVYIGPAASFRCCFSRQLVHNAPVLYRL